MESWDVPFVFFEQMLLSNADWHSIEAILQFLRVVMKMERVGRPLSATFHLDSEN